MSCEKTSKKLEKSRYEKLSFIEATTLKIHLAMCKHCQDYKKYSAQLEEFLEKEFGGEKLNESQMEISLTPEEKQKLIDRLKHAK
jgi:hypothetical protein